MKRLVLAAVFLAVVLCATGGAFLWYVLQRNAIPLEDAGGSRAPAPLPKDAIVLTASEGAEVVAPFLMHDETGAVGGIAAFLPKGSRTEAHTGRVKFSAQISETATVTAWVHARWRDTCSNSCALKVGKGAEFLVGNDDVFNVWHWVPAGKHQIEKGEDAVEIVEREDGVYIDQILLTADAAYVPTGAIGTAGVLRDVRRFADTFSRSPGHGNEGWEFGGKAKWEIAFSFDPNRIPNQYALSGDATGGEGFAFVKGAPWYGCKVSFSFLPESDGSFGCVVGKTDADENATVILEMKDGKGSVSLGGGSGGKVDLGRALRLNQWHRVVVERWAWITRVLLDGREILLDQTILPKPGPAGLFVHSGKGVFDDFEIEEIPWLADDGGKWRISWALLENAKWFRAENGPRAALTGESGSIKAGLGGIPLEEIALDERAALDYSQPPYEASTVDAPGLVTVSGSPPGQRLFRLPAQSEGSCTHVTLTSSGPRSGFHSIALRFGRSVPATFNVGPYTFDSYEIDDPSEYLDFTEEEYKEMARSPEAAKLKRHAKTKPILGDGSGEDESPWIYMGGYWRVNTEQRALTGRGSNAVVRHAQEISSDMEMRLKVRMSDSSSSGEIELYNGAKPGPRVQLLPPAQVKTPAKDGPLQLPIAADYKWHELSLRVEGQTLVVKLDRDPLRETKIVRGDGDRVQLRILRGSIDFDDVEFIVARESPRGVLYGFNQPEPDWWRAPADKWVDHGGIACVLASSWISLVAPSDNAALWNKRTFASDVAVSFNIEENSEWYGWDQWPNHRHFPCDNICAILSDKDDFDSGYRLEVNAENHRATILFRNNVEVARVVQDRRFPIVYIGSHMPFLPRVHRISLIKRGGTLTGVVNAKEVLHFVDPQPLPVSHVGVGGHDSRMNFSHVEIRNLEATP